MKLLNGSWKLNSKLSEPITPILKLEGRSWAQRKAATLITINQDITINDDYSKISVVTTAGPITNISNSDNPDIVFNFDSKFLEIIMTNPDGSIRKTHHSLLDKDTKITEFHYTKSNKTAIVKQVFDRVK